MNMAEDERILVEGLVRSPGFLTADVLSTLQVGSWTEDFHCEEGWTRPEEHWEGYRLEDVLALADPETGGGYLQVGSGDFVTVIPREVAREGAVLATHLNGELLSKERGGPWRLVVLRGACYQSVKWVDRIALVSEAKGETARNIALGRIGKDPEAVGFT